MNNPVRNRLVLSTVQTTEFNAAVYEFDGSAWNPVCLPVLDPDQLDGLAQQMGFTGPTVDVAGNYVVAAGGRLDAPARPGHGSVR